MEEVGRGGMWSSLLWTYMHEGGRGGMWSGFVVEAHGGAEVYSGGMWSDLLWRHVELFIVEDYGGG